MQRNRYLFAIRVFSDQKKICLIMRICMERIGESTILMHFHAMVPDIHPTGELENILATNCI